MDKQYFVLEFAHAVPGQCKRIRVKYKHLAYVLIAVSLLLVCVLGMFSSYARMYWKASHYNELRASFEGLRTKYLELQRISAEHVPGVTAIPGRILGLPALRCAPCRHKFFSMRPLRREERPVAAAHGE